MCADVERSSEESCEPESTRVRTSEVLGVQECTDLLPLGESAPSEVLIAEYLKKKMPKELHHSKNEPQVQRLVDESKIRE